MRLPLLSGRETVRTLEHAGFQTVRQKGSHVRLERFKDGEVLKLTVPLHDELKKGTLLAIIKEAGLTVEEFVRLR
jgi:predicted RNA binding protein YcfA (HicA-like mRNA interferase family)